MSRSLFIFVSLMSAQRSALFGHPRRLSAQYRPPSQIDCAGPTDPSRPGSGRNSPSRRPTGRLPGRLPVEMGRSRGNNRPSFASAGPGRGSKPRSVSGSIRLRALLDGRGNGSSRLSGLAPGESAVSPYPDGTSGATPSSYHRAVSFLLRSSDSRPSGSHPTPCFPERGLSSAAGRCRHGPPSAALHLLALQRPIRSGKSLR